MGMKLLLTIFSVISTNIMLGQNGSGIEIVTDRPDQTESARIVNFGRLQIESGLILEWLGSGQERERHLGIPQTLFRMGVSNFVELRGSISADGVFNRYGDGWKNKYGIGDAEIGAKVQLFKKEGSHTEVAFISHILMPSGSKGISLGEWGTINKLAVSHELTNSLNIGYNIGYDWFSKSGGEFIYSAALGLALSDRLGAYAEIYGSVINTNVLQINANAGMTYLLKENIQLDVSAGSGLNNKMFYISAGISYNIPL
jgi:hypothetical protein